MIRSHYTAQVIAENCRSIEVAIIERRPIADADGDVKYTLVQPAPYASGIGLIDADRDVGGRTTQPGHDLGHQGRGDIVGRDQFERGMIGCRIEGRFACDDRIETRQHMTDTSRPGDRPRIRFPPIRRPYADGDPLPEALTSE